MPSRAKQDFQIFTGGLKGTYVEGTTYPHDRLAEKYPHAFERVDAEESPPMKQGDEGESEGGED